MNLFFIHRIAVVIAIITGVAGIVACFVAYETREKSHKTIAAILISVCVISGAIAFGVTTQTESFQRQMRTAESNYTGGIERTVTVYSYTGQEIDSWSGKFDVEADGDSNEVMFDSEDGRVIIEGGIVVIKENRE